MGSTVVETVLGILGVSAMERVDLRVRNGAESRVGGTDAGDERGLGRAAG